ncbi:hypothetical protein SMGD1_0197 [Sulfurimonas gotlandica GD1]|jgi:hypothetical protein|uniref:Highly acidic protein n=1 Tax=Sulfurimonas gotlandica (strain DSM 19862 / JCM 16533 / GD1) TaxID=929558 RepID=B6BLR4_SULGG|nr:hypothetical protein [Sulfurimonas gotlandica]EDZ62193.1 hypothetical protein CBGD1_2775 [Sulfurimonas gotlandica GD1]EHP28724.1 hypothetical protein SMGD1_0197 [Sulfurimonas gotlandica GD1]
MLVYIYDREDEEFDDYEHEESTNDYEYDCNYEEESYDYSDCNDISYLD